MTWLEVSTILKDFSSTTTWPGWLVRQPDRQIKITSVINLVSIP